MTGRLAAGLVSAALAASLFALSVALIARPAPGQAEVALDRMSPALLVERLGAPDFEVRDAAEAELRRRGFAVREALEAALASPDPEVRLRAERCLEDIRSRDRMRLLTGGTPVTIEGDSIAAEDVCARLTAAIGRPVRLDPAFRSLAPAARLAIREKPFFAALDEACRALGADFEFDDRYDSNARAFISDIRVVGPPPVARAPRAVDGPFLATLGEARLRDERIVRFGREEDALVDSRRDLTLSFQVRWESGLPVLGHSEATVVSAIASDGRSLLAEGLEPASPQRRSFRSFGGTGRSIRQSELRVEVPGIPFDAKALAKIAFRATFVVPTEIGEVLFEALPEEGESIVRGDGVVVATLSRQSTGAGRDFTLAIDRPSPAGPSNEATASFRNQHEFFGIEADGKRTAVGSFSARVSNQKLEYVLQLEQPGMAPRAFAFRYVKEMISLEPTFALEGLALPE